MSVNTEQQTHTFEAEVKQLLTLVAKHLYSNKEVFLRELISNASDAADKLRYLAITDGALYENDSALKIWVGFDTKAQTITVRDNGIGMSREEIIDNLGTIARSGTQAFRDLLNQKDSTDANLIGQFGVGFYSSFVVADQVIVKSRKAGLKAEQGCEWTSKGDGEYTVKNIQRTERGTEIILHIKDDGKEFVDDMRLKSIIRKYSDHIVLPILMTKVDTDTKESPDDKEDKKESKTKKPAKKALEWERVNQANALWTLPKSNISSEQYQELYRHISHDFRDALTWIHNKVEGTHEYISLLYIPEHAPFDLWNRENLHGLKLYVKRIFIMDDAEHFMPMYLRFIKGIIDTNDLPLNVSRELLQSNRVIDKIRSGSVKKVLTTLEQMADKEPEKYAKFWSQFGQVLKEGPSEDYANKERIAKLLRFASTYRDDDKQEVSLSAYLSRMKKDQDKIYYLSADTYHTACHSPLLEAYRKHQVEVLLLFDRIDEWLVSHLTEFEGKRLQSIAKGEFDLSTESEDKKVKEEKKKQDETYASLLKQMQTLLKDKVSEVRLTHRLTDSPACVVYNENEMSGHMQRLMESAGQTFTKPKPIFELNPSHPLIQRIHAETDDARLSEWSSVLLAQALLSEGESLDDPADYVKRLNALLMALG